MRKGSLAVLALVALSTLAAGCNSSSSSSTTSTGDSAGAAVPWVPTQPPQLVGRDVKSPPCHGSDIRVAGPEVKFQALNGGGHALITVTNIGQKPCSLHGRPTPHMVHADGPLQKVTPLPPRAPLWPQVARPESSLDSLRPGDTAAVDFTWTNWCDPIVKGKPHVPPSALKITLPGGRGSFTSGYDTVPGCLKATVPTLLGIGPFQPAVIPVGTPFTTSVVVATVPGQPVHGKRGEIMHYRVSFRNRSETPVSFENCPAYIQLLAPAGHVDARMLNCAGAHPIAPGKALEFEMRLRVPETAPLGVNGLFWELDPFGAQQAQVNARVLVTG